MAEKQLDIPFEPVDLMTGAHRDSAFSFIAGDHYSIADITLQVAVDLGMPSVLSVGPKLPHVSRWHADVSPRRSAAALEARVGGGPRE